MEGEKKKKKKDQTKSSVTEGFHFRPPLRARFPMRARKCDRVKAEVINPLIGSNAGEKFLLVVKGRPVRFAIVRDC